MHFSENLFLYSKIDGSRHLRCVNPVGAVIMAFLLSHLRSHSQKTEDAFSPSRRGYHVELGAREKLLADDPALTRFKSHKKSVRRLKGVGDVLMIVVLAGCCYEIYVKAVMREEARRQARVESA